MIGKKSLESELSDGYQKPPILYLPLTTPFPLDEPLSSPYVNVEDLKELSREMYLAFI